MDQDDSSNHHDTIKSISDDEERDSKKQRLAVEKAIDKGSQLEGELRRLNTSYNLIQHQMMNKMLKMYIQGQGGQQTRNDWEFLFWHCSPSFKLATRKSAGGRQGIVDPIQTTYCVR